MNLAAWIIIGIVLLGTLTVMVRIFKTEKERSSLVQYIKDGLFLLTCFSVCGYLIYMAVFGIVSRYTSIDKVVNDPVVISTVTFEHEDISNIQLEPIHSNVTAIPYMYQDTKMSYTEEELGSVKEVNTSNVTFVVDENAENDSIQETSYYLSGIWRKLFPTEITSYYVVTMPKMD